MIQAMTDKVMSAKFESVDFEISLRQKIVDIMSLPRYLMNVTEALLETDEFPDPVGYAVKTETYMVVEASAKREKRIKISAEPRRRQYLYVRFRGVSPCPRISPMTQPIRRLIPSRIPKKKSVKEEKWMTEISAQGKTQKSKKSNSYWKSCRFTKLNVLEPVRNLLRRGVNYLRYCSIKQSRRYDDGVAHELHGMKKKSVSQMKDRTFSGKDVMSVTAFW